MVQSTATPRHNPTSGRRAAPTSRRAQVWIRISLGLRLQSVDRLECVQDAFGTKMTRSTIDRSTAALLCNQPTRFTREAASIHPSHLGSQQKCDTCIVQRQSSSSETHPRALVPAWRSDVSVSCLTSPPSFARGLIVFVAFPRGEFLSWKRGARK
jgi:hypothetical protein